MNRVLSLSFQRAVASPLRALQPISLFRAFASGKFILWNSSYIETATASDDITMTPDCAKVHTFGFS